MQGHTTQPLRQKLLPLSLTAAAMLLDQLTKCLVVAHIPQLFRAQSVEEAAIPLIRTENHVILELIHVRNKAIAFSLGAALPDRARGILFALVPLAVILLIFALYFRNNDFSPLQRWAACGILGGGLGNLIDRFFRPDGVVDFMDCIFFGSFGWSRWPKRGILSWERWPTFNVADAFVVVCGVLLVISFARQVADDKKRAKED